MDISKYVDNKDAYSFQVIGDALIAVKKKWDPETGAPSQPEVQPINLTEVKAQKAKLQESINAIDAFIADAETLLKPVE